MRGYSEVLNSAWNEILTKDKQEICKNSLAIFENNCFKVKFFGEEIFVDLQNRKIIAKEKLSITAEILILHYLINAKEIFPSENYISFREFKNGEVYFNAFKQRAIIPIAESFALFPNKFSIACRELKGEKTLLKTVDYNCKIFVFPKIPINCILLLGDEEVSSNANILFDATANEHLHIEDVAILGEFVSYMFLKKANIESEKVGKIMSYEGKQGR